MDQLPWGTLCVPWGPHFQETDLLDSCRCSGPGASGHCRGLGCWVLSPQGSTLVHDQSWANLALCGQQMSVLWVCLFFCHHLILNASCVPSTGHLNSGGLGTLKPLPHGEETEAPRGKAACCRSQLVECLGQVSINPLIVQPGCLLHSSTDLRVGSLSRGC